MKEILAKKLKGIESSEGRYNALREGLQHLILKILDDSGQFRHVSFVGGTALRVVYDLRRFSEDMDFSLQKPGDPRFDFGKMVKSLVAQLEVYGLPVDTRTKETGAVRGVFLKFKDVLQDLGVSRRKGQKLAVKLEVDTNPPGEARHETSLLQKEFLFTVLHHDLPTLFAGKLLAFLYRNYTKGRDVYDLVWYLSRKVAVNRRFFENGLFQSTNERLSWSREELLQRVGERIDRLDLSEAARDVRPFLDDAAEIRLFDKTLLKGLVPNIVYDS